MPLSNSIQFSSLLKGVIISRQIEHELNGHAVNGQLDSEVRDNFENNQETIEAAYERGVAEGKAKAEAEIIARAEEMDAQFQAILTSVTEERKSLSLSLQNLLPELVIEGVGRILYGLEPDREMIQTIISDILKDFDTDDSQMRLFMHPEDLDILKDLDGNFCEVHPGLRLIADDKLHRGECHLDSRFGVTDARFSAKLANLRKVFE